jgi:hypothetical protein
LTADIKPFETGSGVVLKRNEKSNNFFFSDSRIYLGSKTNQLNSVEEATNKENVGYFGTIEEVIIISENVQGMEKNRSSDTIGQVMSYIVRKCVRDSDKKIMFNQTEIIGNCSYESDIIKGEDGLKKFARRFYPDIDSVEIYQFTILKFKSMPHMDQ